MAEIVVGEWTPIGTEGFEYNWEPAAGDILWRHPVSGAQARCEVSEEDRDAIAYILQRRTWDLEKSYRKQQEGLTDGSAVWF